MSNHRRLWALLLCALLALSLCLPWAYAALEAKHDCAGEGCQICAQIESTKALPRAFTLALFLACALYLLRVPARTLPPPRRGGAAVPRARWSIGKYC